jgi:chemotaxis protein CheD
MEVFLQPGEICMADRPTVITTLLGSCVAVTMFSPQRGVGGICHGLLPSCRGEKPCRCDEYCLEGIRYVDCSIMRMLAWFRDNGIPREELVVKVFGGSDMLPYGESVKKATIGRQNIDVAFRMIEQEMLKLAASDVGGERGRKIIFSSSSGEVLLKRLNKGKQLDVISGRRPTK